MIKSDADILKIHKISHYIFEKRTKSILNSLKNMSLKFYKVDYPSVENAALFFPLILFKYIAKLIDDFWDRF